MGIATYETSEGNKDFEIRGDAPTDEERASIEAFISRGARPRRASRQELVNQILAQRGGGQTPGQPAFTPTHQDAEVGKLDRYVLGKAEDVDTARGNEKEVALTRLYGQDSWGKAEDGKYYLKLDNIAPEIKQQKGLPETGTMYVNKPGGGFLGLFNMPDVFDFMGAYRGELIGGTIAASAAVTGGLSLIPASIVIGVAAGTGKAVDELQELAQGRQLQSKEQVIGDIATAAAWNAGGNIVGGGIARLAGRVIKGPGAPDSKVITDLIDKGLSQSQATAAAVQMQRTTIRGEIGSMLEKGGARPTISESTGKSILGRLQGIHEAIFPNRKAARLNREHVQKLLADFQEGVLSEAGLTAKLNANARRINEYVGNLKVDPEKAATQVRKELRGVIAKELENIRDTWSPQAETSGQLHEALQRGVRLWSENNKVLYQHADDAFAPIFYVSRRAAEPGAARLFSTDKIKNIAENMVAAEKIDRAALLGDVNFQYIKNAPSHLSLSELQQLRMSLRDTYTDALIKNKYQGNFAKLSDAVDESFDAAEANIMERISRFKKSQITYDESGIPKDSWPKNATGGTIVSAKKKEEALKRLELGFDNYAAGQKNYKEGAELFKSAAIEMVNKNIADGFAPDLSTVVNLVVQNNKPGVLNRFLKSLTPQEPQMNAINAVSELQWKQMAGLARAGNITELNSLIDDAFRGVTGKGIKKTGLAFKAPPFLEDLAPDNAYRNRALKDLAETFDQHAGDVAAGAGPDQARNFSRDQLARSWMKQASENANFKLGAKTITPEAEDLIRQVDEGGVPFAFTTNFRKIADENGIPTQGKTPGEVIDALRAKQGPDVTSDQFLFVDFNPADLHKSFDDLGKSTQEILFGKETAKELGDTLRDLSLASPERIKELLKTEQNVPGMFINKKMRGVAEQFKKTLDDAEAQSKSALFEAVGKGRITNPEDIILAASKDKKLMDDLIKSVGEEQLEAAGGLKDATMAHLMRRAFPETQGVVTEAATVSGAWSKNLKDAITELNTSGYLNKLLGKETVDDLLRVSNLPLSDASIKGIGGIVSAAYGAGLGMAILANPVAGLAGVAGVYLSGRVLRSKAFLRLLTRPNISTAQYRSGVRGLTDDILSKNKLAKDLDPSVKTINRNEATAMAKQQLGGDEAAFKRMISEIVATEARVIASVMGSGLTDPQTRQDIRQGISAASDVVSPIAQEVAAALPEAARQAEDQARSQFNQLGALPQLGALTQSGAPPQTPAENLAAGVRPTERGRILKDLDAQLYGRP